MQPKRNPHRRRHTPREFLSAAPRCSRWPAMFMPAQMLFLRSIGCSLASAWVSSLNTHGMQAAVAIQPVALHKVAWALAAATLPWLQHNRERALLITDFGAQAAGLLVPDTCLGYAAFAEVDACPVLAPARLSLVGQGSLVDSEPPRPACHPADEWAFVECTVT